MPSRSGRLDRRGPVVRRKPYSTVHGYARSAFGVVAPLAFVMVLGALSGFTFRMLSMTPLFHPAARFASRNSVLALRISLCRGLSCPQQEILSIKNPDAKMDTAIIKIHLNS